MSEYTIPQDQAVRLDARARDLESRIENLVVGVTRGVLRRTELLNQLATGVPSEEARDVTGLSGTSDVETIVLTWGAVSDPLLAVYEVQWSLSNDFLNPTSRYTTNLFYVIAGLDRLSAYFVRVRARVGQEIGRWSPTYSAASGKAAWSNLAERSVSNLVRITYGDVDAPDGPDWFTTTRFSLVAPVDYSSLIRANGPSFCRAEFSAYNSARYVPPVPMQSGGLDGDDEGGCIIGPLPIDTAGGFVELSFVIGIHSDTTWNSGIRAHILRDRNEIAVGGSVGDVNPYHTDYSFDYSLDMMVVGVSLLDAPLPGLHEYEIALEPYCDFTVVPGPASGIFFIKWADVQMLELRR